jgi:hypothetical protein
MGHVWAIDQMWPESVVDRKSLCRVLVRAITKQIAGDGHEMAIGLLFEGRARTAQVEPESDVARMPSDAVT